MASPSDLTLPKWVTFWLKLTSFICIFDGAFIVFRPHTFPDGSLGFIFWAYKYYFEVDRMYGDLKDSFVYAQAICNWLEVALNLVCLYLEIYRHWFRPGPKKTKLLNQNSQIPSQRSTEDAIGVSTRTKLLTLIVTTMTFWKTVVYFIVYYNMDFRANNSLLVEFFLVFLLNGVWIAVPFSCMKALFQDICQNCVNAAKNRMDESNSPSKRTFEFRESTLKQKRH